MKSAVANIAMGLRSKIVLFCVGFVTVAICIFIVSVSWQLKKSTVEQANLLITELTDRTNTTVRHYHSISKSILLNHLDDIKRNADAINIGSATAHALSRRQVEGVVESLLSVTQKKSRHFSIVYDVDGDLMASSIGGNGFRPGDTSLPMALPFANNINILDKLNGILQREKSNQISPQQAIELEKETNSTGFYFISPEVLVKMGLEEFAELEDGALTSVASGIIRDDFFIPVGISIVGEFLVDIDDIFAGLYNSGISISFFIGQKSIQAVGYGENDRSGDEKLPLELGADAVFRILEFDKPIDVPIQVGQNQFISRCSPVKDVERRNMSIICTSISDVQIKSLQELISLQTNKTRMTLQLWLLVTGGVLLCGMYFCAKYLARQFTKPIDQIVNVADKVGKGDFSKRLCSDKQDEIGVLANAFDLMLDNLEQANHEREKLENKLVLSKKMEAIGTLAGGVAHDLNNILSGIVTLPQLLLKDLPDDSPLRPKLHIVEKSGAKAARIVEDMLTLSKSGMTVAETIDVKEIIKEYLESPECLQLKKTHPLVNITTSIATRECYIKGSPVHLDKMLMNLVNNSADAIDGYGDVIIGLAKISSSVAFGGNDAIPPGDYAYLSVSDTGSGITREDQLHIFEPFFSKKVLGRTGTGLGMVIVWNTIKDHNGFIKVHSDTGHGTTMHIYLPVTNEKNSVVNAAETPEHEFSGSNEKILVVDDVEMQREIAVMVLNGLGYDATALSSGLEAIEYVKHEKVDLVITDMIMDPGISGLETAKEIFTIDPQTKIILVSGFSETGMAQQALEHGVKKLIQKPYSVAILGTAVREILQSD